MSAPGTTAEASRSNRTAGDRDRGLRVAARFAVAALIGFGVGIAGWILSPHALSGRFDVIGYPLYADFDVNRYFDAFYLIALVFPIVTLATYVLLARVGPLRRVASRRRATLVAVDVDDDREPPTALGRWGRVVVVGAIAGFAFATGNPGTASHPVADTALVTVGWTAVVAAVVALVRRHSRVAGEDVRAGANALATVAVIALAARVAARAGVFVTSTGRTEHFALFPIQVAIPAAALALGVLVWRTRRSPGRADLDQAFVRYLAVPIAIFLALSVVPGPLGPMDTFGEGEYLAAGTRILDGALPWRDLWLIHGLLDDGLKALVGFGIFGMSRWGATAGITALLVPAYFVAFYLFAAYFVRRSWALVAASAVAFGCGVFVDWDVRYLLLPIVLITFVAVLRRPTVWRGGIVGFALVAQAVLVPELTLAVPPLAAAVALSDLYRWRGNRTRREFRSTAGVVGGLGVTGVVFGAYLIATHSLHGFVDYYRNFANAHSLTGGIPLFVNYAVYGPADKFGVHRFTTTPTGLTTRYAIELVLPLVAILLTIWIVTATVRGGRRLRPEDFATIGMAGLVLLYFQKSISRGDVSHIGEVFAVSTPLVVALVARLGSSLDRAVQHALERWQRRSPAADGGRTIRSLLGAQCRRSPLGSLAIFLAVAIVAPVSVNTIVGQAPGHFVAVVPSPAAKPVAPGDPSLGFASPGALPVGLVTNLNRIFTAEAGPHGSVFDLSDAPGIVDFLLHRNPASRFYDISLAITPAAQQLVVADLVRNHPKVVLFSGISGLSSWDYIANEVRQYIVSAYILNHYRPLVYSSGELVFIADDVTPVPLPKLVGHPTFDQLYFSQGTCDFGNIPDFLSTPAPGATALNLPIHAVASRGRGHLYRVDLPASRSNYEWLALDRSGSGPAGITLGNIVRASGADVPWHDITWVAKGPTTTVVPVGSCLQWHGFGPTLYLRYVGPGHPTSLRLFNA